VNGSDHEHLEQATRAWIRNRRRARVWGFVVRVLPYVVVALLLYTSFRVFG
jgi:hypothetical protein